MTPATSGAIAIDGKEIAITNPGMAMDAGMAFLTEDRKESGCFLLLDIMANMQIALLRRGFATRGLRQGARDRGALPAAEAAPAGAHAGSRGADASISPAAISRKC